MHLSYRLAAGLNFARSLALCAVAAGVWPAASADLALVDVNVVDVRTGSVKREATVAITGSKITAVLPSKSAHISSGTRIVECRGDYLIPGLWDMHVHSEGDRRFLRLLLAAGITGARDMGGDVHKLTEARRQVRSGSWEGPTLFFAGPMLEGPPGHSNEDVWILHRPEEAQHAVQELAALHVDFIKVHDRLVKDVYLAIASAAKQNGLPFAGHVPASVTPLEASDSGQASIEHFEFLPKKCVPFLGEMGTETAHVPDECKPAAIEALLRRLAANGTWLDPTVQSFRYWVPSQWEGIFAGFRKIAGQIRRAQVRLLAGTDSSGFLESKGAAPGRCLHDELELLVAAGFTPLQALQAATVNPAIFLTVENSSGTVEAGKTADLVLLGANPLVDIRNTRQIVGVIARGALLDESK